MMSVFLSFLLLFIFDYVLYRKGQLEDVRIPNNFYIWTIIFVLYLLLILKGITGFPTLTEWMRLSRLKEPIFNPNINLMPFNEGILTSDKLNILLFVPLGFMLPVLWKQFKSIKYVIFYGFLFSLCIEMGQLFVRFRISDINDLLMNTLGAVIGYIIFILLKKLAPNFSEKTKIDFSAVQGRQLQIMTYVLMMIPVMSTFLS